jgi:hypothetical protein
MSSRKELRDWLFRGLMWEADAERFRAAGLRVGADAIEAERSLLEETLSPFGLDLRDQALRMTRLYALIYCFENSVRNLIAQRLEERHGIGWWASKVPKKVRDYATKMQEDARKNSWLEGQRHDQIAFITFGHLADIVTDNWDDFSDLIPTQQWLRQRMEELEKARNFIAHNRYLLPAEFQRLEMYVSDWNRTVGL